ncbi:MAG: DUF4350 domain-containing protein [Acidobacteria bacterium]|nr:DUF4350 domain-containing protein [Acidobacteriota bacterium]
MPLNVDPRDRRMALGALAMLVLLVGLALLLPNDQSAETEVPSSYSASSGGAKAAFLLLGSLGYRVSRWTRPPQELPENATAATLILAIPTDQPGEAERHDVAEFVNRGGRVLAVGIPAMWMFKDAPIRPGQLEAAIKQFPAMVPGAMAQAAPRITMAPYHFFTGQPAAGAIGMYGDDRGAVVVRWRQGQGEVVWWAGSTPLTNAGLRYDGSVELLLSSIGEPGRDVLWDEYFHGLQHGVGHVLGNTPLPFALLQCGILLAAAVLTFSRRSGPIYEPLEPSRLSPLEYAETLGGLYRRANAGDVAVQVGLERFRILASRSLGVRPGMPAEQLKAALSSRFRFHDQDFVRILQECEAAPGNVRLERATALRLTRALQRFASHLKIPRPGDSEGTPDAGNHSKHD